MDEEFYCTKCGKKLAPEAQFCQYCGETVIGSPADLHRKEQAKEFDNMVKESRRTWLLFLLAIYAIPAAIISAYILADTSAIANTIWGYNDMQEWYASHPDVTLDTVKTYVMAVGAMVAASSICAIISLICCYLRKYWIVAVVTCFLASLLCIFSIFGMIVGLFVSWMIMAAKDSFTDTKKPATE